MSEMLSNLLKRNRETKTLEEYEKMVKESTQIWKKSHEFNTPTCDWSNFDDYFIIAKKKVVKKEKNSEVERVQFLRYIQFFYKTDTGEVIEGNKQIDKAADREGRLVEQVFELDDDEYIIKMIGRAGFFVISFGFITSKGRELYLGLRTDGEPKELSAPNGFHFTNFGSNQCHDGIYCIMCDSISIPNSEEQIVKQNPIKFEQLGTAARNIIDCLGLNDIFTLFKVNKYFASWRYSPIFLNKFAIRIIYSCNIQKREYIKELMKNLNKNNRSYILIEQLLSVTKNRIPNPFGDQEFSGFTKTKNGGDGIIVTKKYRQNYRNSAFLTSFAFSELMYEAKLADIFDEEFLKMLNSKNACIVAGCYMRQLGFGAEGYVQLTVTDDKANKVLFSDKLIDKNLTSTYTQYFLKYEKDEFSSENAEYTPTSVKLLVGGKDTCYWGGHFGNLISGITLRGIPFYQRVDKTLLSI